MGGYNSGRYRTRNQGAVEASLRLDIRDLRRRGYVRPNVRASGPWSWTYRDQRCGSINVSLLIGNDGKGEAVLNYAADGEPKAQRVRLVSTPCHFGGRRWYFLCPRRERRCEVLCFAQGSFASRQAQCLTYSSQSEDELGRLCLARDKARGRLDGAGGRPRPRGANRERQFLRWADLDDAADDLIDATALRRFGLEL